MFIRHIIDRNRPFYVYVLIHTGFAPSLPVCAKMRIRLLDRSERVVLLEETLLEDGNIKPFTKAEKHYTAMIFALTTASGGLIHISKNVGYNNRQDITIKRTPPKITRTKVTYAMHILAMLIPHGIQTCLIANYINENVLSSITYVTFSTLYILITRRTQLRAIEKCMVHLHNA